MKLKPITQDIFPEEFVIEAVVVSDAHLNLGLEHLFSVRLQAIGLYSKPSDKLWRWMVRTKDSLDLFCWMLQGSRTVTDTLISIGDQTEVVINERGLAELRARLNALEGRRLMQSYGWNQMFHVPADHDIGTDHLGSDPEDIDNLNAASKEFEETLAFRAEYEKALMLHPDLKDVLTAEAPRDNTFLSKVLSIRSYQRIFGPLYGALPLNGKIDLVWASDVIAKAENDSVFGLNSQTRFLESTLRSEDNPCGKDQVFLVHEPQSLKSIDTLLHGRVPWVECTIAGHLHVPLAQNFNRVVPTDVRKKYKLRTCPSLTANNLPFVGGGGCLFLGTENKKVRVMRYSLATNSVDYVF